MRATLSVPVAGVLGLCLLSLPLLRLIGPRGPAAPLPIDVDGTAPSLPRSPSEAALREASQYRTLAKIAVNQERETLTEWDPQVTVDMDAEAWRLELLADDRHGYLEKARRAALVSLSLARTSAETRRATELMALLEHEAGHHAAELEYARRLIVLQPGTERSQQVLQRAALCNGQEPSP
jgi:hypothetical protein